MGGGDVEATFTATLKRNGTALTSKDLVELYPPISSSSTPIGLENCKFFDLFDADPAQAREEVEHRCQEAEIQLGVEFIRRVKASKHHHPLKKNRQFDFRLEAPEKTKLAADDDLPVFVTADSILHAWHRSFDAFLMVLETNYLAPLLEKILDSALGECRVIIDSSGKDTFTLKAVMDVEIFLIVGLSLLRGKLQQSNPRLDELWSAVQAESTADVKVFSAQRTVDFSLFKPRGHYTKADNLERHFRAMMWLGTIDFRIAGGERQDEDLHQLLCAVLLVYFIRESQGLVNVARVDALISTLIADGALGADSLSVDQLARILAAKSGNVLESIVGISNTSGAADIEGRQQLLVDLQQQITQKGLGAQLITGHPLVEDASLEPTTPTVLPTSFALLGQRFVWSSFLFTRLVFDQVLHQETKQPRRIPSAVDIVFALFGNNETAPEIAQRMNAEMPAVAGANNAAEFVPHRDGIPFASNLIALRQVIDEEFDDSKTSSTEADNASISTLWLRALRALSKASPNAAHTFHSKTWQHRQMNTQIGSFTQLRHDSVLYAKQSYTCCTRCEYPDGMVDPYPHFWQLMREMALRMKDIAESTLTEVGDHTNSYDIKRGVRVFKEFATTMKSLEDISECQVNDKELNKEQIKFMKSVMEERFGSGATQYSGWYPGLFYDSPEDSGKRDVLVVDIHTDSPSVEHGPWVCAASRRGRPPRGICCC